MYVGQVREVIAPRVHGQSVVLPLAAGSVRPLAQSQSWLCTKKWVRGNLSVELPTVTKFWKSMKTSQKRILGMISFASHQVFQ